MSSTTSRHLFLLVFASWTVSCCNCFETSALANFLHDSNLFLVVILCGKSPSSSSSSPSSSSSLKFKSCWSWCSCCQNGYGRRCVHVWSYVAYWIHTLCWVPGSNQKKLLRASNFALAVSAMDCALFFVQCLMLTLQLRRDGKTWRVLDRAVLGPESQRY